MRAYEQVVKLSRYNTFLERTLNKEVPKINVNQLEITSNKIFHVEYLISAVIF